LIKPFCRTWTGSPLGRLRGEVSPTSAPPPTSGQSSLFFRLASPGPHPLPCLCYVKPINVLRRPILGCPLLLYYPCGLLPLTLRPMSKPNNIHPKLERLEGLTDAQGNPNKNEFSSRPCDCCGDWLAGERYEVKAIRWNKRAANPCFISVMRPTFNVCPQCVWDWQ